MFYEARWEKRRLFFRAPALAAAQRILFVKRQPFLPSHNYSVILDARGGPGGGVCRLDIPRRDGRLVPDEAQLTTLFDSGDGIARNPAASFDARQIYFAIWRAWHYRLYLTTDDFEKWAHGTGTWFLRHQTRVRFVIERSGQVTGIRVEAPSDCIPLNDSAADALAEVILPRLPDDFPRDREVVHALFIATGEVMMMRPSLRAMRERGLFGPTRYEEESIKSRED